MEELNIEKFNPTVADLNNLVELTKQVVVTDINDKYQIDQVKSNRILLRDARVNITKRGKELRSDALAFQKAVIEKERELIAIIEPEEERLKAIEEEVKAKKLRAERIALLPERRKRLAEIGDAVEVSDDELNAMDASEFQGYVNKRVADKNEAERQEIEKKQAEIKAEEDRLAREKETREREEKARQEEREKIEREQKEKAEREEREKKEAEEKAEREKKEAEERAEKEKAEMEANEKYQAWLKASGYDENTCILKEEGNKVVLYRRVSEYQK